MNNIIILIFAIIVTIIDFYFFIKLIIFNNKVKKLDSIFSKFVDLELDLKEREEIGWKLIYEELTYLEEYSQYVVLEVYYESIITFSSVQKKEDLFKVSKERLKFFRKQKARDT